MQGPPISINADTLLGILNTGTEALHWMLVAGVVVLADLIAGGLASRNWLKKIPTPDRVFTYVSGLLTQKLNRRGRTALSLRVRGALILLICLPITWYGGVLVDSGMASLPGTLFGGFLLLPLLHQKAAWLDIRNMHADTTADPHLQTQQQAQRVILQYAAHFMPNLVLLLLGGATFLLPFRFLAVFMVRPDGSTRGTGPFYDTVRPVYNLLIMPGLLCAYLLLILARFFMPGTRLAVFSGLSRNHTDSLASTYWPLLIVGDAFDICFRQDSLRGKREVISWIGPKGGIARLKSTNLRQILTLVVISSGLSYTIAMMIFAYLSVQQTL